jgi:hypothetical protein
MASAYGYAAPQPSNQVAQNYSGTQSVGHTTSAINPNNAKFPQIELHVSAKNLTDMDIITVSDPICVLFVWDGAKWVEFGRTEIIWNNLNPEWVKFFTVQYVFEMRQPLLFRVYDVDSNDCDLSKQDFIGEALTELSQIVSASGTTQLELHLPKKTESRGTLFITPEQIEGSASIVEMKIKALNLKKLRWIIGNSPFFTVSKSSEGGRFLPIYQSEVESKMRWKQFTVPFQQLCNCDPDRPIRISFMDYRRTTAAVLIGYADTTYTRLSESLMQQIDLVDEKGEPAGKFVIEAMQLQQKYNFYDFLRGGVQLNLITAIDFTGSNRDPRDPRSLHYIGVDSINSYEKCIRAVGEILCPYDSDQMFPMFGFGAKVGGVVSHCFPLTFNPQAPCVHGLEGMIGAYRNALVQVQLSGPTLFSQVINETSRIAQESWAEERTYTILLIITDGIINDMQDTKDAIVAAGRIPLSIIIVGVGNADFTAMDVLDADDVPLVSRAGYTMERDLVQFVPFNQFANQHYSVLAAEVLDEIPRQLVEWAELNGVRPNVV